MLHLTTADLRREVLKTLLIPVCEDQGAAFRPGRERPG
jgi:hypothetical protein